MNDDHLFQKLTAEPDVLSVSQLNARARQLLEDVFPRIWVEGELSNLSRPSSGHMYFTLKDDRAQIRCALFRQNAARVRLAMRDGQQIRDWLFVEDHTRGIRTVLETGVLGETYNIGGHNEKMNIDVVQAICRILDSEVGASGLTNGYAGLVKHVSDRPGHDRRYAIDASKIERELGWRPMETFETGLEKTVRWYLSNENWWLRVLNGDYRLNRIGESR